MIVEVFYPDKLELLSVEKDFFIDEDSPIFLDLQDGDSLKSRIVFTNERAYKRFTQKCHHYFKVEVGKGLQPDTKLQVSYTKQRIAYAAQALILGASFSGLCDYYFRDYLRLGKRGSYVFMGMEPYFYLVVIVLKLEVAETFLMVDGNQLPMNRLLDYYLVQTGD